MADTIVKTRRLLELERGLRLIESVEPPPTARGRYALAKAGDKIVAAAEIYRKEDRKTLERHAVRDDKGKPVKRDLGGGRVKYELLDEAACEAERETLLEEDVTLSGIRPITHAEFGSCPIPVEAERLLLGVLIEDVEPPPPVT